MRTSRLQRDFALALSALWVCAASVQADEFDAREPTPRGEQVVRPSHCESEAVLLADKLELRPTPDLNAAPSTSLGPGTSIYRCEQRGAFFGIMFPEPGGKVDCSMRPAGRECPTGWADVPPKAEITG